MINRFEDTNIMKVKRMFAIKGGALVVAMTTKGSFVSKLPVNY